MVKLKICGITEIDDYLNIIDLGVDFTGFIFYKPSPRYVEPKIVKEMVGKASESNSLKVGVFVNEQMSVIREIYQTCNLDVVQLHGDESIDYCTRLNLPYWKVVRIGDGQERNVEFLKYGSDIMVLDTYHKSLFGGTGKEMDLIRAMDILCSEKKIIVGGGVGIHNIVRIHQAKPYGIDVNSSVEDSPGKKNILKIKALYQKLRELNGEC